MQPCYESIPLKRRRFSADDVQNVSADLLEVEKFRYSIYVEEQGKTYLSADHVNAKQIDSLDASAVHYVLRVGGLVSAYFRVHECVPVGLRAGMPLPASLREEGTTGYMSRLMVSRNLRGSNAAIALLLAAYRDGLKRGNIAAVSHVRPELVPFYERLGLYRGGDYVVDEHVGINAVMILMLHDVDRWRKSFRDSWLKAD